MRLSRRIAFALAGLLLAGALTTATPTEASSAGAIAGSCDLVQIRIDRDANGKLALTTPNRGICVVSKFNGVNVVSNGGQVNAQINFTSSDISLACSGNAVRGFNGLVKVTVTGASEDIFTDVTMIVDGAPGSQTLNPTATALIDGTRFAGAGTFTRSNSRECDSKVITTVAAWTLGHITFEDPTLGGSGFPGS